jgi:flagellin
MWDTTFKEEKIMRINHNIAALNTIRQLGINANNTQKALEKLSSGLRINSAADDAAGLAISEKMRGQISGLEMAQKNAQDGISLISTAEGALNETHSILQRMRELAVQSANDTNTNDDRAQLQKEMDQLSQEVTRISTDTQFNGKNLLDGSFSGTLQIGANKDQNITLSIDKMNSEQLNIAGKNYSGVALSGNSGVTVSTADGTAYTIQFAAAQSGSGSAAVSGTTAKVSGTTIVVTLEQAAGASGSSGAITATEGDIATALNSTGLVSATVATGASGTTAVASGSTTLSSGFTYSTTKGINISTQSAANNAIKTIDDAINTVSTQRSTLGAYQNRLEHTINNLGTSSQNLTAAESRIRDVDMAKEMAEFTKNNILNQAAQAMLAQANQLPQGVLQLLR